MSAHGASDRSIAYQAQISALNNPQRPLAPGLAVSFDQSGYRQSALYMTIAVTAMEQ